MDIEKQINKLQETLKSKQARYGDSFPAAVAMLKSLYPNGISHEEIPMAFLNFRIIDKIARKDADEELDIAGMQLVFADYLDSNKQDNSGERINEWNTSSKG